MNCPNCGSENVNVQVVTETELVKKKRHGAIWWLLVGWWWVPVWWICFTLPALIVAMIRPKNYGTKVTHKSLCVCQNCGHHWNA